MLQVRLVQVLGFRVLLPECYSDEMKALVGSMLQVMPVQVF
jgi:hypothetical protein